MEFGLHRFSVYSGFGLDRFHCITIFLNTNLYIETVMYGVCHISLKTHRQPYILKSQLVSFTKLLSYEIQMDRYNW